jgi:hypothetical protein
MLPKTKTTPLLLLQTTALWRQIGRWLLLLLLGMELFGWFTAPFLVLSCGMAYLLSGKKSIYRK